MTERHQSFCRLCQAACGIVVSVDEDRVIKIEGDRSDPLSRGYTCEKGRALGRLHHHPDRLLQPLMGRGAGRHRVTWDELIDDLGRRLASILEEHGPDAIAIYNGTAAAFDAAGRIAQLGLLAAIGTRSRYTPITIDCPSKLLVAELVGGNMGLVPVPDYDRAQLLLYVGSNPVVSHGSFHGLCDPVSYLREVKARGEIWVIDVRRTETGRLATRHIRPRPGTDVAILGHAVRELLLDGAAHEHLALRSTGSEALAAAVARFDRTTAAAISGVEPSDLADLVSAIRRSGRLCVQTGTGISMGRAANTVEYLAWVLQIITESFERPGGQWFNPSFLSPEDEPHLVLTPPVGAEPGPASRPELARRFNQFPCAAMADEIEAGNVRAVLAFGGNPLTAFPDPERLQRSFEELDILAVWDVVPTPTVEAATHVLPALDSLERADVNLTTGAVASKVVGRYSPRVMEPAGNQRAMWWSTAAVARRMGLEIGIDPASATDDSILTKVLAASRVSADELQGAGVVVCAEIDHPWVESCVLPDGRWQLAPADLLAGLQRWQPPPDGLVLTPRRERGHVNSTLAGDVPTVELHPEDAVSLGIADGDAVRVTSASGEVELVAHVHDGIGRGAVSVPHGYRNQFAANRLISATDVDELTGMVVQSGLSVEAERVER
jgi:anaerobic selenocysteine-containing dehydrogenase